MRRMSSTSEIWRSLHNQDPKWLVKALLRAVAVVFACLGLVLFSLCTSRNLNIRSSLYLKGGSILGDGLPLGPLLLSLLHNAFSMFLIFYICHSTRMHPGWNVCVDFIIWGLCIPSIAFAVWNGWYRRWQWYDSGSEGIYACTGRNMLSERCAPEIYAIGRMEIIGCVFLTCILIIHLTLFTLGCIEIWTMKKEDQESEWQRHNDKLQYHRTPEDFRKSQLPPPSYQASTRATHQTDVRSGKKSTCPDCNLPGLGCCNQF